MAISLLELVVVLWIPYGLRMKRLRQRERERFGEYVMPGGDRYEQSEAFLQWAPSYDDGDVNMRSRRLHKQWLSTLPSPIIGIEGEYNSEEQTDALIVDMG